MSKNTISTPNRIKNDSNNLFVVKTVRCGLKHTLLLSYNGQVFAIGDNSFGQCGQDVHKMPYCHKPVLIEINEPVKEIGAWAKSSFSMARCVTNKIFIWGPKSMKEEANNENYGLMLIEADFVTNSYLSNNWVLSKFQQISFPDENKILENNSLDRFLITTIQHQSIMANTTTNSLINFLNNPKECDLIFNFDKDFTNNLSINGFTQAIESINGDHFIFVQNYLLTNYNFLKNLPRNWLDYIPMDDILNTTEDNNSSDNISPLGKKIKLVDLTDNKTQSAQLMMDKQRKRFQVISLDKNKVNPRAFYAYLLYIYSSKQYTIISAEDIFHFMSIAQQFNEMDLFQACFNQLLPPNSELKQICIVYSKFIKHDLEYAQDICHKTLNQQLNTDSHVFRQKLQQLYLFRSNESDVCLHFLNDNQKFYFHKLVLFGFSNFYRYLNELIKDDTNSISAILATATINELLKMDQITIKCSLPSNIFEIYFYYIYHSKFQTSMNIGNMVKIFKLAKILNEHQLEKDILMLIDNSVNNVAEFYLKFCFSMKNVDELKKICFDKLNDFMAFILSDDFNNILFKKEILKAFFIDYKFYLKNLINTNK